MTYRLILIILLASATSIFAQSRKSNETIALANKYYEKGDYYMAQQLYSKASEDQTTEFLTVRIAECYRKYFDYKNAENWYKQSLKISKDPLNRYWYALMLKKNGKYALAKENFEKFLEQPDKVTDKSYLDQAHAGLISCVFALHEYQKPVRDYYFNNLPSPVNSPASDYAPVLYKNDTSLVLTSSRKGSSGKEVYNKLGDAFSDNYLVEKNKEKWEYVEDKSNFSIINTPRNDGAGVFTKDKQKYYFTRCEDECAIYYSKMDKDKWQNPVKLNDNINMPGTWNAQPALSEKGDTLFFVSKREGGKGMHDIWISISKVGEDNWGPAQNLSHLNTHMSEMSPTYYSKENTLFFSSDGYTGFGGLDIYKATGKNFENIDNIGLPFNSSRDDFYFVLGDKKGYLSSNREEGLGNDDIFQFNIESREALLALVEKDSLPAETKSVSIKGRIVDEETNEAVTDVEIYLNDENRKLLKKTTTNKEGDFRFENLEPENYRVTIDDKNPKLTAEIDYIVDHIDIKSSKKAASKIVFENIYFEFDEYELRPEAKKTLDDLIALYKTNTNMQIEMNANTDNFGTSAYNKALSEKRGKAALEYLKSRGVDKSALVINGLGEENPFTNNDNPIGRQLNRRVEFSIVGFTEFETKTMIYIVEPNLTLYSIARKFKMTERELKELNGLHSEKILAFKPLRVKRTPGAGIIAPITLKQSESKEFNSMDNFEINERNIKRNK